MMPTMWEGQPPSPVGHPPSTAPPRHRALTVTSGTATFNSSATVGPINISNGRANFTSTISPGTITLSGGILDSTAAIDATTLTWSGGTLTGSGSTNISGTLTIGGTGLKIINGHTLNNNGTAAVTGTGSIGVYNAAVIHNGSGATFDVQTSMTFALGGAAATFNNEGSFSKTVATGTTVLQMLFNNSGMVDVQTGTLTLGDSIGGTAASTGPFVISSGAWLRFAGSSSQTLNTGATVTGAGSVEFIGGTVALNGTYNVGGTTSVTGGAPTFYSSATLGTLTVTAGTATFNSSVSSGAITLSAGTLTGTGAINATSLNWTGGTMAGTGSTSISGPLTISGTSSKGLNSRTLINKGMATVSGTGKHQCL